MSNWRWRKCPGCGAVRRASAFSVTEYKPSWNARGDLPRCCPACGWEGPTWKFQVVRERHPAPTAGGSKA